MEATQQTGGEEFGRCGGSAGKEDVTDNFGLVALWEMDHPVCVTDSNFVYFSLC